MTWSKACTLGSWWNGLGSYGHMTGGGQGRWGWAAHLEPAHAEGIVDKVLQGDIFHLSAAQHTSWFFSFWLLQSCVLCVLWQPKVIATTTLLSFVTFVSSVYFWIERVAGSSALCLFCALAVCLAAWNGVCQLSPHKASAPIAQWTGIHILWIPITRPLLQWCANQKSQPQNVLKKDYLQAALFGNWNRWLWNIHAQAFGQAFFKPSFKFCNLVQHVFLGEHWNTPIHTKQCCFQSIHLILLLRD